MIPRQVKWPYQPSRSYVSPFQRGAYERDLRISLHSETLQQLTSEEQRALGALCDLATLPNIEMVETGEGTYPRLVFDLESEVQDAHGAAIWRGHEVIRSRRFRVDAKSQFPNWVDDLARFDQPDWVGLQSVRDELLMGIAHMAVGQDLFVTTSPRLLALRDNQELLRRHAHVVGINSRLPSEALKLAALFQRSRDEYRAREFEEDEFPRITVHRGQFYSTVAYDRVPEAWRFESASGRARRPEDTYYLAKSVTQRCVRALEARDALGFLFYVPNAGNITDRVVYHFDYLNLILSGIFDALGRMTHRVYGITSPTEFSAGFHREDFRRAIRRSTTVQLDRIVSDMRLQDFLFVIGRFRNTIHGRAIEAQHISSIENMNMGFIEVPDDQTIDIWDRVARLGVPEAWGVRQVRPTSSATKSLYSLHIEPYTYAIRAVNECLHYVNQLMIAIDTTRLLPTGFDHSQLRIEPQNNEFFSHRLRNAVAYLG